VHNKSHWLDVAETLDALRVFPRIMLVASSIFTCWYAYYALNLAIGLVRGAPATNEPAMTAAIAQNAVAGVVGLTVPMIGQVFAKIVDVYLNTGRKWDGTR